jgi:hypothetical protein
MKFIKICSLIFPACVLTTALLVLVFLHQSAKAAAVDSSHVTDF